MPKKPKTDMQELTCADCVRFYNDEDCDCQNPMHNAPAYCDRFWAVDWNKRVEEAREFLKEVGMDVDKAFGKGDQYGEVS